MKLVVILGPTGVGKTATALTIAGRLGVDIINADSRQIYAELPIGTAAPTEAQLRRVRHHFVGTLHLNDYYSASMYEQDVLRLLDEMFAHNDTALMAGGSMMYIDAVCNGIDDIPTVPETIRTEMKRRYETEGLDVLLDELQRLDPEYYDIVDRHNYRRVIHALEICHTAGQTYTSLRTHARKERPFRTVKIGLTLPREELYDRINRRVDDMIEHGLVDEARSVYGQRQANALNTVGYKELFDYFDGRWSLSEAVERIKGNTRRYCRKQLTWFKRDTSITWFNPDDTEGIINRVKSEE